MLATTKSYTTKSVLASLGYSDPWQAARQHARMILLGRQARYQAGIRQLEGRRNCALEELRIRYVAQGSEDAAMDDDYLQWQWYADAIDTVNAQLRAIEPS